MVNGDEYWLSVPDIISERERERETLFAVVVKSRKLVTLLCRPGKCFLISWKTG